MRALGAPILPLVRSDCLLTVFVSLVRSVLDLRKTNLQNDYHMDVHQWGMGVRFD